MATQSAAAFAAAVFDMITPSFDGRRSHFVRPSALPAGADRALWRLGGLWARRPTRFQGLRQQAMMIQESASRLRKTENETLLATLAELRTQRNAEDSDLLPWMLVAMERATGLWAHVEQVIAALGLACGFLVEAATGEGKTLSVGLAAAASAWRAPATHVLTANDYLAARDAEWLRPFYARCGLAAGCVTSEMSGPERAANYSAQITYTTPKELAADFLRDRLLLGGLAHPTRRLIATMSGRGTQTGLVLRGLFNAIVDEADHALIDDAVTPLIISRKVPNPSLRNACVCAHSTAQAMERNTDYVIDAQFNEIRLLESGESKLAAAELRGVWSGSGRRAEIISLALKAREFFRRGHQYFVDDGKVVIVDESTGRAMPQRTWRGGLHQAVEAKEGVEITDPSETLSRLSFQRFFRLFGKLAGITGTAREAAAEFWQIYGLPILSIPTHRPCIREQWPDRHFVYAEEKWQAVADEVRRLHRIGRPVLAGTGSIAASQYLAKLLAGRGLPVELLNAVEHQSEAEIVARAGELGRITIATNMAGRGTDIRLAAGVAKLGGLHVIATEKHRSRRVDRQLYGRSGRQGDPGSAQAFVSLEDDLPKLAARWLRKSAQRGLSSGWPGGEVLAARLIRNAQTRSERMAAAQREQVLAQDLSLDEALAFAGAEI